MPDERDGHVPRAFDKIQVLFKLNESDADYWWPAVVLQSKESPTSSTVKGTGVIEYAARHNNKEEQEQVIFLADRVVSTGNGDTPWRTSTEAADEGEGDDGDRSWENGSDAMRVARKRRVSETCDPVSDEETVNNEGERPKRVRGRSSVSVGTHGGRRHHQRTRKRENTQSARGRSAGVGELLVEVQGVKAMFAQAVASSSEKEVQQKVGEKKMIWKVAVEKILASALKENPGKCTEPFNSVLQVSKLVYRDTVSYETFTQVVQALVQDTKKRDSHNELSFLPSLTDVLDPDLDIGEAHVQFISARAMLRWLGIGSPADVKKNVVREQTLRNGKTVLRILGGLQWVGEVDSPLRIFVGRSCAPTIGTDTEDIGRHSKAVEFASARFDNSNNLLAAQPTLVERDVGLYGAHTDFNTSQCSVFTLSWTWMKGLEGRAFSESARSTGTFRLGNLTLTLPYVLCKGAETCKAVSALIK